MQKSSYLKINYCPICEGKSNKKLEKFNKDYLVKCNSCNFVFSDRKPTQIELDVVYNSYDYEASESTNETISKKDSIVQKLTSMTQVKSVLDVGCGNGEWLDSFRRRGCSTYGTEYNERQRKVALSKGHKLLDGGLFPLVDEGQSFDIIVFTEVIEHIQNPKEVLSNFNKLLNNKGILFITTPNFSAIERYILGDSWGIVCYPEHLTYFTPKTLNLVLEKTEFSKVQIYTENISLYRILQGLGASKKSQISISDNIQSLTAPAGALSKMKKLINKILSLFGIGVSIVAIYKKS